MVAVEEKSGLEKSKQTVFFKGKKLVDLDQTLQDAGVSSGDTLNIVPARKSSGASPVGVARSDTSDDEDDDISSTVVKKAGSSVKGGMDKALAAMSPDDRAGMEKLMGEMGGREGMQNMLKQMGLDGPMTPEKIESMIAQVKGMMENPQIKAMFEDPEVLERSRQQIIGNPMLMNAYDSMGMGQLIRDPKAFRDQMEAMKSMLQNPELLKQAMKGLADQSSVDEFDQGEL